MTHDGPNDAALASPTPETTSPEVKQYERQKLILGIVSIGVSVAALLVAALLVGPFADRFLRQHIENPWLRLILIAFVCAAGLELLTLPLDFWSGFVLEHRHQLSNQSFARWLWKKIKMWLVGGPLGLVMLLGLYALLWYAGVWWWMWAAAAMLVVSLVLGQLLPIVILPLFYKVTRLDDGALLERLRRLADGTGLGVEGVYRLHLSVETKKANAALAGLGRTRRVLLGDTLLDSFTPEEIEVVFAHEVGHHVHRHLMKLIMWSVLVTALGFWLVDNVLKGAAAALGYAAFDDPGALPLLLLVLAVFGMVMAPLQNAVSRFFEWQCDRYALQRTRNPEAYRAAFLKLARLNKSDLDPHPLVVWLFDDHPPIRQRLALADRLERDASDQLLKRMPTRHYLI